MGIAVFGVVGFAMLISTSKPNVQYAGVFLGAMGIYPCISNTISWVANNTEGVYKRGITMGFVIGWGNLNGSVYPILAQNRAKQAIVSIIWLTSTLSVVSSNIYRAKDAPGFKPGHGVVLAYEGLFLLGGSALYHVLLRRENAKRRSGARDHWVQGKSEAEIEKMGDTRPDFMYTL